MYGYPLTFNAALLGRIFYSCLHEFVGTWFVESTLGTAVLISRVSLYWPLVPMDEMKQTHIDATRQIDVSLFKYWLPGGYAKLA